MHLTQQHQDIAGQVSQSAVAAFILAPAPVNLPTIGGKPLVVPCAFRVICWESLPLLFIPGHLLFEFINLSARACLSAIKTAGVQEKWPADLLAVFVHAGCGDKGIAPPVCSPPPPPAPPTQQFPLL